MIKGTRMTMIMLRGIGSTRFMSTAARSRTALITGGTRGIGLSIAQALAQQRHFKCILLGRDEELLKENITSRLAHHHQVGHCYEVVDFNSSSKELNQRLSSIVEKYFDKSTDSHIDVLINCGGVTQNSLLPFTSLEVIQEIVQVNLVVPMLLSKLVSKKMLSNRKRMQVKPGQIINISSVLAKDQYDGIKGTSIYATTKSGLIKFSQKLNNELRHKQIFTNVILPSLVRDTGIGQSVNVEEFEQFGGIKFIEKKEICDEVIRCIDLNLDGQIIEI